MRINKFVAASSDLSRRAADEAIAAGRVLVNGQKTLPGQNIAAGDTVTLDNLAITPAVKSITIMLNKPRGYIVSRDGQGSKTIYDLLPLEYQRLNPVGRLDKDSSGLLLLTNDGQLAHSLTHPSRHKVKIYEVTLDKPLEPLHQQMISDHGIVLEDGSSKFMIEKIAEDVNLPRAVTKGQVPLYRITMHEGRNRQIRRTFSALGYTVQTLHRTHFGSFTLNDLPKGAVITIELKP